jgi:hypothetical protein
VIKLNDVEETAISENGEFTFDTKLSKDDDYTVSVKTQPSDPVQACAVEEGSGKIDDSDIDNVRIACSNVRRSIGGTVSGLGGGQIKLKNNDADELTVTADGGFTFPATLEPGADYAVTVSSAPANRTCSVGKGTGEVSGNNITDVSVNCYAGLTIAARARVGSVELTWESNSATSYTVHRSTAANCDFANPSGCAGHAEQANVQSPYIWPELVNGTVYYFAVVGNHPDDFKTRSTNLAGARPNGAEIDGIVNALARGEDGTVYVGGAFSAIGPYTGPLAPLDKTTGRTSRLPGFPIIAGSGGSPVSAVLADGSGGYFVGGTFDLTAGTTTISNLAHVLPNGTLDEGWNPEVNGEVRDLALVENKLYFAGTFTNVKTIARGGIAAVSTAAGAELDTAWNPNPTPVATVYALVANTTGVYVAGAFTNIGNAARTWLAGLNRSNGEAISAFPTSPDTTVNALALAGDTLYLTGAFSTVGGQTRNRLAGINLTTNQVIADVQLTSTQTNAPDAIAVAGDFLYLGGNFTSIQTPFGTAQQRNRLAAVNRTNGQLANWNPGADGRVQALVASGETIYVAGEFQKIGSTPETEVTRKYLAAIGTNGDLSSWSPQPGAAITGLSADNDTVYAFGGDVRTFGVETHEKLAAFKNGSLTTWGPAVSGGDVLALAVAGNAVYVGGTFNSIGGQTRQGVASVSDANAVRDWNAQLNDGGQVNAILAGNGRIYLGGSFTNGGGSARTNLVAVNTEAGARPDDWALTGVNGRVHALALDGTNLYVGGEFGSVVGAADDTRDKLAKLNANTGENDDAWDPGGVNATVRALTVLDDKLIVGGSFTTPRTYLAAVDKDDAGALNAWAPVLDGAVTSFAVIGQTAPEPDLLYAGGAFTTYDASGSQRFALIEVGETTFDRAPGVLSVSGFGSVNAVAVDNERLYLGGDIRSVTDPEPATFRCWFSCSVTRPLPPP